MIADSSRDDAMSVFAGTSELARLMRSYDWAGSPVGPPSTWPRSLQTVVRLMLTSRYAMWMGWGKDLTFFYNDAYAAMSLGAKHPWALGKPSREVWAEIWPQIGPRLEQVLNTGEATWDEGLQLFLERSGFREETYHTFSYSPLFDDVGKVCGNFCVVIEETERVVGERRLAVLRDVAAAIATTNTERELWQAIARSMTANNQDLPFTLAYLADSPGAPMRLAYRAGIAATHPAAAETFVADRAGGVWPSLGQLEADGTTVSDLSARLGTVPAGPWDTPPSRALILPIPQPGQSRPAGYFIAGINPLRPLDNAFRSFVGLLVGQIAAGLANTRTYEAERRRAEALAEIDRAKTAFFSNVSHEFRTPLTLLLGPLEDALSSPTRALAGQDLDTSYRNALRLLKLVNALLDFARIEAGRVRATFAPTDLASLTRGIASGFNSAVERAGLRFVVDCDRVTSPVYVDRDMWEKVVLNLLSNAFKFTFEGEIRVTLEPTDDGVALTIADTGIGVNSLELPRLFERFHRIEGARSRTHEGSGIGLALVHELVQIHGGTISADSEVGVGTRFVVTLKYGSSHLPAEHVSDSPQQTSTSSLGSAFVEEALKWLPAIDDEPGIATAGASSGRRIVVADDNADMRGYITRLLSQTWRVEAVANGREALDALQRAPADLLLTDVMMPEMDGFELLRAVKSDPALSGVPVVMLSARSGEEARIQGLDAGADDYLFKPFSARELIARVNSHLELASARTQASRAKDEFLAMLGHELRNPLAPILTALQLMRLKGQHSREQEVIQRQVNHLTRLVDDLLDVSRITRGKIELQTRPIELATVVARAMETVSPLLEQRQHHVDEDVPRTGLTVSGDPDRLAQVVANLLTNAAKYSDAGSRITIRAVRADEWAELTVRDEGVGIAPEMLRRVFEPFVQQAQTLDRSQGGLGLGLTIVKSLVDKHGGSIVARSEGLGRGSEFSLRLPVVSAPASEAPHAPWPDAATAAISGQHDRILVVDDNQDAADMMRDALRRLGYEVALAHDGPSAIEASANFAPHVALLDIGLPVMDGYELAQRLRAEHESLRLIAVSGYGQDTDRERSAAAGFEQHLVKPIHLRELQLALQPKAGAVASSTE